MSDPLGNGNADRLLGRLVGQAENIEREIADIKTAQERISDHLMGRITRLELNYASASGGMRMLILLCGGAATIGGLIAMVISHLWGH